MENQIGLFCLLNTKFFPELWLCQFMRQKQILDRNGKPVLKSLFG